MIIDDFYVWIRGHANYGTPLNGHHVFEYTQPFSRTIEARPSEKPPYDKMILSGTSHYTGKDRLGRIDFIFNCYRLDDTDGIPPKVTKAILKDYSSDENIYAVSISGRPEGRQFRTVAISFMQPGVTGFIFWPLGPADNKAAEQYAHLAATFNEFLVLLNCKNIVESPIHPSKSKQRNRKRKGLRPLVSYKVLKVVKGKTVSRRIDHRGGGNDKRMHSCRGHYKEYTADKPLFGHTVGRVWCPAHVRGNKKLGAVVKSYEVSSSS
jgi:hypothetical protein